MSQLVAALLSTCRLVREEPRSEESRQRRSCPAKLCYGEKQGKAGGHEGGVVGEIKPPAVLKQSRAKATSDPSLFDELIRQMARVQSRQIMLIE